MSAKQDIQKLSAGTIIILYELDARAVTGDNSQIYYFHNGLNELGNDVVFGGIEYVRYPIEASGFEKRGDGRLPRPKISVSNAFGVIGQLSNLNNDLYGAKLTRTRTFLKYLDSVNFKNNTNLLDALNNTINSSSGAPILVPSSGPFVNPYADPNQKIDEEIYFVDRKSSENKILVEFELRAIHDLTNVKLPRRQVIQNICLWEYRSANCGYGNGPAVADENDNPTNDLAKDKCGKRLSSCRLRFPNELPLPYGGFPGAGLTR